MRRVLASPRAYPTMRVLTAFLTVLALAPQDVLAEPGPDKIPDILGTAPPGTGTPSDGPEGEASGEETSVPDRHWSLRAIDFTHKVLSQGVGAGARGMDSFFATEEALTETNASFVRASVGPLWVEGKGVESSEDLDVQLHLPGTERRLKLFVGRDTFGDEDEDRDEPVTEQNRAEGRRDGFGIGLEGRLNRVRVGRAEWQFLPAAGVKIRTPPDPFLRFRTIRRADYGRWRSSWSNSVAQFLDEGFIARTRLTWDRPLARRFVFRSRTSADWGRQEDVIRPRQRLTLFHKLTPDNRLAYDAEIRADDKPEWQVENYFLQLRYRNRFYKKWLFFELRPRLSWPRSNDFGSQWSLLLSFEAIFGYPALSEERRQASGREPAKESRLTRGPASAEGPPSP